MTGLLVTHGFPVLRLRALVGLLMLALLGLVQGSAAQTTTHSVAQEHLGAYNALRSGATPTSYTTATILSAMSAVGTDPTLLYLAPATWTITSNITLPRTITPWFTMGAVIDVAAGMTLTMNGQVRIDGCDVFTGAGSVVFGPLVEVDPCWFGVKGDGVTDDLAALQKAANSAGVASIRLRPGTFVVSGTLTLSPGGGHFRGAGHGVYGASKILTASPTADILAVSGQGMTISGLQLDASVTRTAGAGIHIDQVGGASQNTVIERIEMLHMYIGIYQQRASLITVRDNIITVTAATGVGALIQNTDSGCDANTGTYHNNNIYGPSNTTVTGSRGIWYQAGGGLILSHNQIFGFGYNVYVSPHASCTTQALSEFRILGNNLDGFTVAGIQLSAVTPLGIVAVSIVGNNLQPVGAAGTEAIVVGGNIGAVAITGGNIIGGNTGANGIHMFSDGTTPPYLNYIGGNILSGSGGTRGIYLSVGSTIVESNIVSGWSISHDVQGVLLKDGVFTLATLPLPSATTQGSQVSCTNCGPNTPSDRTCASGSGAIASRTGSGWSC